MSLRTPLALALFLPLAAAADSADEVRRADSLFAEGDFTQAELLYEAVLDGDGAGQTPRVFNQAGLAGRRTGKFDTADAFYKSAIRLAEAEGEAGSVVLTEALLNLAELDRIRNRLEEAEQCARRALALRQATPNAGSVAEALNNLGAVLEAQGDRPCAASLYERALVTAESPLTRAALLHNLGVAYFGMGQFTEAAQALRQAVAIRENALGEESPATMTSMANLAEARLRLGITPSAEALYRRLLEISERLYGPEHPGALSSLERLAYICREDGRLTEAENLYARLATGLEAVGGPFTAALASALENLAGLYTRDGRYLKAAPLFERSIAIWERLGPAQDARLAGALSNYALTLRRLKRKPEAEAAERRATLARAEIASNVTR